MNSYCVVTAQLNAHLDELDAQESFDTGLREFVIETYVDEIIWSGRVETYRYFNHQISNYVYEYTFLHEVIDSYIQEVEDEGYTEYLRLSAMSTCGKLKDEDLGEQLEAYILKAVNWYFLGADDDGADYKDEYLKHLEREKEDMELARAGL